jgi:hypothetical protein
MRSLAWMNRRRTGSAVQIGLGLGTIRLTSSDVTELELNEPGQLRHGLAELPRLLSATGCRLSAVPKGKEMTEKCAAKSGVVWQSEQRPPI